MLTRRLKRALHSNLHSPHINQTPTPQPLHQHHRHKPSVTNKTHTVHLIICSYHRTHTTHSVTRANSSFSIEFYTTEHGIDTLQNTDLHYRLHKTTDNTGLDQKQLTPNAHHCIHCWVATGSVLRSGSKPAWQPANNKLWNSS